MYRDIDEVLISEEQIQQRVQELGQEIGRDYQGKLPIVIGLLKGSCIFVADLVRAIPLHLTVDFMGISSYGAGTKSSGVVKITKDLEETIEGRHVIIAEDIIDTGLTLNYLLKMLKQRNPASIKVCTLLNKQARRLLEVEQVGYIGFEIEDHFVVGYGLDYVQKFRNLPCIGILKPVVYQKFQVEN
ncbi:hypoxanthine phosphoribosyltransferase [bacterium (Candidatus Blackallbacteria) CG17_big_fil_post_rev_8_21_14_2_50_48_46]|uniref:Hypoxanthine phosphoribosyltransferase n=1 Tax=bacterium (Candidatus Blackallbacteria) CG17_big_fil_post_rev_8_21_14_2_50_48_46 TaxID=2014261 RepID=A0A2M7G352_9BACT|nr:MAG: hypoxanthine phosphoribosyltransferase [bacterium (Candidatus Blackallbacteria) CG18_big_fil_WC_8_21_14_2_50_49_26]PIW16089.1 MAG: hypoxanthine phosphoribosyltransferase [bacterium (Candidatus Blackallbacteria) CG17_big_fil_post_rev_8_21_14_2_50_48_46]PIW50501.1 MAG: hypoxanthine phosphoribosyltransferase [bacterium (Candidatus Blackallbacteria) CG13_big_fil_rev_8_21_14_2_50_49_14]